MKKFLLFILASLFMVSCGGPKSEDGKSKEDLNKEIQTAEARIYSSQEKTAHPSLADPLITLYLDYGRSFPDDEKSPEYYFKAGELSSSIGKSEQAISIFQTVHKNYPKYDKAPYALFLQGFIYENQVKDLNKAKEIYNKVIETYPNHEVANQSKMLLENLGKSDEELIREFEEKNKKSS